MNFDLPITQCTSCGSLDISGMFLEYYIQYILKDACEVRKLSNFIDEYTIEYAEKEDKIFDIVFGSEY